MKSIFLIMFTAIVSAVVRPLRLGRFVLKMSSPCSSPVSTVWAKLSGDLGNEVFIMECDFNNTTIDNMKRIVKLSLSPLLDTIAAPKLVVKGSDGIVLREDITLASRPEGKTELETFII